MTLLLSASTATRGAAQERSEAPQVAIQRPQLQRFSPAAYTETARHAKIEGRVLLELTIDPRGAVTRVVVREALGYGLDESATAAARSLRFTPASRRGQPTSARILFSYSFELPDREGVLPDAADEPAQNVAHRPGNDDPKPPSPEQSAAVMSPAAEHQTLVHREPVAAPALEVTVLGRSRHDRLRESALAVDVVDMRDASRRTGDLADALSRSRGVSVRRSGGLGAAGAVQLDGFVGDQVRFFVDGVPLELAGYPLGLSTLPNAFVDRLEVYRGVVPSEFGADALGGAINVVTDDQGVGIRGSASYQAGSFDTHRIAAGARHTDAGGWVAGGSAFLDRSENDYPVQAEVFDSAGRLSSATVHRFHDAYRARGATFFAGLVRKPWARRLTLHGFYTAQRREVQHNALAEVPYGEVGYEKESAGGHAHYALVSGRLRLDVKQGFALVRTHFSDLGECRYDWLGRCVPVPLPQPGEIEPIPRDQVVRDITAFGYHQLSWFPDGQQLRVSVSPQMTVRNGEDRQLDPEQYDPLRAQRSVLSNAAGVEHEVRLFDERLANIAFVKHYLQFTRAEEELPNGNFRDLSTNRQLFGYGDSARLWLGESLYLKAAYEHAARLPTPTEVFGDGVLVVQNLHITPERSHNFNLALTQQDAPKPIGAVRATALGFARFGQDLIVPLPSGSFVRNENVLTTRTLGLTGSAGWSAPKEHFTLDVNATWIDLRNASGSGPFAQFEGDRVPNRPQVFGNLMAVSKARGLAAPQDELSLHWHSRYLHPFFIGWESLGDPDRKLRIEPQLIHSLGLTYLTRGDVARVAAALEVANLTDHPTFDFYGVQQPGRSVFMKITLELQNKELPDETNSATPH